MNLKTKYLLAGLLLAFGFSTQAKDIEFGGYTWAVRSSRGGPGPNGWDENNAWLDASTNLHLKISQRDGKWSCAEVTMRKRLGFGRYQFQVTGRIDRFDDNVVLGLFTITRPEMLDRMEPTRLTLSFRAGGMQRIRWATLLCGLSRRG